MSDESNQTPREDEPLTSANEPVPPPAVQLSADLALEAPSVAAAERRLWGPTLWISGALLWGYVVLGELVVNTGFQEGLAVITLFGVLGWSWFRCTKPLLDADRTGRAVLVAAAGVALFVSCLFLISIIFGSAQRSHFESVTVLLCGLGAAAYATGRRLTTLPAPTRRADRSRVVSWFVWIVVGLFTLVAIISAMAHV
jgi:hypothetical protein